MNQEISTRTTLAKSYRLLVATAVLLFTWCVILPRLGRTSPLRDMIDRNQKASIDPSALFYSDLEHLQYDAGMLRYIHKE